jgi:hypothetical protein
MPYLNKVARAGAHTRAHARAFGIFIFISTAYIIKFSIYLFSKFFFVF